MEEGESAVKQVLSTLWSYLYSSLPPNEDFIIHLEIDRILARNDATKLRASARLGGRACIHDLIIFMYDFFDKPALEKFCTSLDKYGQPTRPLMLEVAAKIREEMGLKLQLVHELTLEDPQRGTSRARADVGDGTSSADLNQHVYLPVIDDLKTSFSTLAGNVLDIIDLLSDTNLKTFSTNFLLNYLKPSFPPDAPLPVIPKTVEDLKLFLICRWDSLQIALLKTVVEHLGSRKIEDATVKASVQKVKADLIAYEVLLRSKLPEFLSKCESESVSLKPLLGHSSVSVKIASNPEEISLARIIKLKRFFINQLGLSDTVFSGFSEGCIVLFFSIPTECVWSLPSCLLPSNLSLLEEWKVLFFSVKGAFTVDIKERRVVDSLDKFGLMEKLKKLEADNDHLRKEQDEKLVKLNEEQKKIISALQEKKVRLDLAEQNSLKTQAQLAHFSERPVSEKHGDVFQFVSQYAAHAEREDDFQFKAPVRVTPIDPSVTARDSLSEASMQFLQRQQSISQEAVNTDVAESPDWTEQSKKESAHTTHPDHCSSGTGQLEDSTPNYVSTTQKSGDCPGKLKYSRDYLLSFRFLKECKDPPKELIRPDSSMLDMIKRSGGMDLARLSSNRIDMFAPAYSPMPGPSHAGNKRGSKSDSSRGSRPGGGHGPKIIEITTRFEVDRQQDLVLALEKRIGSISDTNEDVMSYIKKHHTDQERCTPSFVFALSCAIGNASVSGSADAAVYNQEVFTLRCLLLKPLVDCEDKLQEEVIYGLQCSIHKKQHPTPVLDQMFTVLYESDVVEENVFLRWFEKGRDEEGRGMTLTSVSPFITWLNT